MYPQRLQENLPRIRDTIAGAAARVGRSPDEVTLVAVTKGHPLEAIHAALDAGLADLGENRVSELEEKAAALDEEQIRWHMIGHVQSRKAPRLVGLAELVHSVDRDSLARKLSRAACEADTMVPVLVQVNTSGEKAKGGLPLDGSPDHILRFAALPGLRVEGLMTMAPYVDHEPTLRKTFRRLRALRDEVRSQDPGIGGILSMGMTNDLGIAVEEGSTLVRIGTALFGERPDGGAP